MLLSCRLLSVKISLILLSGNLLFDIVMFFLLIYNKKNSQPICNIVPYFYFLDNQHFIMATYFSSHFADFHKFFKNLLTYQNGSAIIQPYWFGNILPRQTDLVVFEFSLNPPPQGGGMKRTNTYIYSLKDGKTSPPQSSHSQGRRWGGYFLDWRDCGLLHIRVKWYLNDWALSSSIVQRPKEIFQG